MHFISISRVFTNTVFVLVLKIYKFFLFVWSLNFVHLPDKVFILKTNIRIFVIFYLLQYKLTIRTCAYYIIVFVSMRL